MRKNSIRKFVHAVLDLIPLFIIPIFAIYTRNENYNSNIEVQVQESEYVDFNQLLNNVDMSQTYSDTLTLTCTDNVYHVEGYSTNAWRTLKTYSNVSFTTNHIYLLQQKPSINTSLEGVYVQLGYNDGTSTKNLVTTTFRRFEWLSNYTFYNIALIYGSANVNVNYEFTTGLYDLTQMFGEGNEPSIEEFNAIFTNGFYPYTISQTMRIDGITKTYNDTDVGSQFVYTLYNATDKYFNMNNVFNMKDVYDWFVLNIFGGNAPLGLYIVWNIVLYEFVMDLLMLLYSVFMFFIDCCTKLIEKPLNAIK